MTYQSETEAVRLDLVERIQQATRCCSWPGVTAGSVDLTAMPQLPESTIAGQEAYPYHVVTVSADGWIRIAGQQGRKTVAQAIEYLRCCPSRRLTAEEKRTFFLALYAVSGMLTKISPAERIEAARNTISRLHPEYEAPLVSALIELGLRESSE